MTNDEQTMLDELLNVDEGLYPWEIERLERLNRERDKVLSYQERSYLEVIWERVLG